MQAAPAATRRSCRAAGVVGVLGGGDVAPALAQQLAAVLGVQGLVAAGLEGVDLPAVGGQLGAEVADALVGLVLLGRVELLLGERVVLVDGLLEGRQRRAEGAEGRGAEEVGGAVRGGRRRGGGGVAGGGDGGILVRGREVGEVPADGCALLERTVEGCVLRGGGNTPSVRGFKLGDARACALWVLRGLAYHGEATSEDYLVVWA